MHDTLPAEGLQVRELLYVVKKFYIVDTILACLAFALTIAMFWYAARAWHWFAHLWAHPGL